MNSTVVSNSTSEARQGWTSAPNNRGTIDIITSCCLTLFLCCWAVLVVNVPAPTASRWALTKQKFLLMGVYLFAPEIVVFAAAAQWMAARETVKIFRDSGYNSWTLRHGFYANMGAIHLKTPDWKSFPIDAKQLHYLIKNNYVEFPMIDEKDIRDRNKVDGALRLLTLAQAMWFVINVVGRAIQHLPITVLELSTTAWVLMGVATSICWMSKPADVEQHITITTIVKLEQILIEGGEKAGGIYYDTPLDFISRKEWTWSKCWSHARHVGRRLHFLAPPVERPVNHIQNLVLPEVDDALVSAAYSVICLAYCGIFVAGWNFSFPTRIELVLWRVATLTTMSTAATCWLLMQINLRFSEARKKSAVSQPCEPESQLPRNNQTRDVGATTLNYKKYGIFARLARHFQNNSALRDPALDLPPLLTAVLYVVLIIYGFARAYVFMADIVELRSLPASMYQTVNWWQFMPHL